MKTEAVWEYMKKDSCRTWRFQNKVRSWSSIKVASSGSSTQPAVQAFVVARAPSRDSLRAATCAGIHVPSFLAHSIGCRDPDNARHWLTRPASRCFSRRWLDGCRGTHGPAHSCVARVYGVGPGCLTTGAGINTRTHARGVGQGGTQYVPCAPASTKQNAIN